MVEPTTMYMAPTIRISELEKISAKSELFSSTETSNGADTRSSSASSKRETLTVA